MRRDWTGVHFSFLHVVGLFLISACVLKVPHWHIGWILCQKGLFSELLKSSVWGRQLSLNNSVNRAQCQVWNPVASPNGAVAGVLITTSPSAFITGSIRVLRLRWITSFLSPAGGTMSCMWEDVLFQRWPSKWGAAERVLELREAWEARKCRQPASNSVCMVGGTLPRGFVEWYQVPQASLCTHTHTHTHRSKMLPDQASPGSVSLRALNSKTGPWLGGVPTFSRPRNLFW